MVSTGMKLIAFPKRAYSFPGKGEVQPYDLKRGNKWRIL